MTFKLNENESIELVYSFRSAIYFEQITNHNVDFQNFNSNDLITLFYCVVIASLQKERKPIITMLDFLDDVDSNGGEKCIIEFANWYAEVMKAQYEAMESTINENDKVEKPKSKKKKTA